METVNRKTVPKINIVLTVLTHKVPLHIFTFLVTRELIIKVLNENYKLFPLLPPLIRYIEYSYKGLYGGKSFNRKRYYGGLKKTFFIVFQHYLEREQ